MSQIDVDAELERIRALAASGRLRALAFVREDDAGDLCPRIIATDDARDALRDVLNALHEASATEVRQ